MITAPQTSSSGRDEATVNVPVEVFWRPGCPSCRRLRGELRRRGLPLREINIWQDPDAAQIVRAAGGGNETVPTVRIGAHLLVNPTVDAVLALARPDRSESLDRRGPRPGPAPAVSWRRGPVASLVIAAVWAVLAIWHPTTTYHLGPALVAAAWPLTLRGRAGIARARVRAVVMSALGGTVTAFAAIGLLAARHALAGPTVLGGHGAMTEAFLAAVVGAAFGGWLATRPARSLLRRARR